MAVLTTCILNKIVDFDPTELNNGQSQVADFNKDQIVTYNGKTMSVPCTSDGIFTIPSGAKLSVCRRQYIDNLDWSKDYPKNLCGGRVARVVVRAHCQVVVEYPAHSPQSLTYTFAQGPCTCTKSSPVNPTSELDVRTFSTKINNWMTPVEVPRSNPLELRSALSQPNRS